MSLGGDSLGKDRPLKLLDFVVYRARHAALIAGLSNLALLTLLFHSSRLLDANTLPEFFTSSEQLLGSSIMLILLPSLLGGFLIASQRRSMRYGQEIFNADLSNEPPDAWLRPMNAWVPLAGTVGGLAYGLIFNTPILWLRDLSEMSLQLGIIVCAQAYLWTIVGITLSFRLHTAIAFNKLGRTARLDLFGVRELGPFARNGVDDVMAIALLLVITTAQSLDAQFRYENYATALLVAIPSATFLFLLPMVSIHNRLVRLRRERDAELNREIQDRSTPIAPDDLWKLELLMQHRDRIREANTWPIDWSIYSRLAFYVILPPIAWIAAAFVEFGVDRVLSDR